jgi:hypothetical protein
MTRTRIILSVAILLGSVSASLAMSPTGNNYRPFPNAYASARPDVSPIAKPRAVSPNVPTHENLVDRQSAFYRI